MFQPTSHPGFRMRAFPKAVLSKPETPWPTPYKLAPTRGPEERRVNMSLQVHGGKNVIHKYAVIRNAVKQRIKVAIMLIVTYGANRGVDKEGKEIVAISNEDKSDLILQGELYLPLSGAQLLSVPRLDVCRPADPRNIQNAVAGTHREHQDGADRH